MKRIARIASALLGLALCLSLAFAPLAFAAQTPYVRDEYGVLSSETQQALEDQAEDMADEYNIGVYLLYTDDVGSKSARQYAMDYYLDNDLGVGSLNAGILFLVAVDSRDYVTVTYGDAGGKTIPDAGGIDAFTDARIQNMEYDIIDYLRNGNWANAARAYYNDAEETLAYLKANGEPMDNYRLDYKRTEESEGKDFVFNTVASVLAVLGIGGIAAGGSVRREKSAMLTAVEAQEASNYLQRDSFQLTASNDQFVNTTLSVVPIPKNEDKGSGGAFGGGFGGFGSSSIGGGFGGSGGGKF